MPLGSSQLPEVVDLQLVSGSISCLCFLSNHLSPLVSFPASCVLSVSPEGFRLRAAGGHEEAAGEAGSRHLRLGGGVF